MGSGSAQSSGWDTQDSSCGIRISTELRVGYTGFKLWDQDQHRAQGGIHRIQAVGSGSAQSSGWDTQDSSCGIRISTELRVGYTGFKLWDQDQHRAQGGIHRIQAVGSGSAQSSGCDTQDSSCGIRISTELRVGYTGFKLWDQDQHRAQGGIHRIQAVGSGSAQSSGWDTQDSSCGIRISTELRVGYTGFKLWDQDQHRAQGGIHRIQAVGSGSAQSSGWDTQDSSCGIRISTELRVGYTGFKLWDQDQHRA